jgi:hypothetical protein
MDHEESSTLKKPMEVVGGETTSNCCPRVKSQEHVGIFQIPSETSPRHFAKYWLIHDSFIQNLACVSQPMRDQSEQRSIDVYVYGNSKGRLCRVHLTPLLLSLSRT